MTTPKTTNSQRPAIRPFADNPADKVEALVAERGAGLDEKAIIFYPMQASDGEKTEAPLARRDFRVEYGRGPGEHAIDAKTLQHDFLGGRGRIVVENVLAVVAGDGHAKAASAQLGREQVGAFEQIGAVQGEAEADSEQTGGGQGHPGSEVSVMSVNVFDMERLELFGQRGAHYGVAEGANAADWGGSALQQQRAQ